VEFRYAEPYLLAGGLVSGASILLCAFLCMLSLKQKGHSRISASGGMLDNELAA